MDERARRAGRAAAAAGGVLAEEQRLAHVLARAGDFAGAWACLRGALQARWQEARAAQLAAAQAMDQLESDAPDGAWRAARASAKTLAAEVNRLESALEGMSLLEGTGGRVRRGCRVRLRGPARAQGSRERGGDEVSLRLDQGTEGEVFWVRQSEEDQHLVRVGLRVLSGPREGWSCFLSFREEPHLDDSLLERLPSPLDSRLWARLQERLAALEASHSPRALRRGQLVVLRTPDGEVEGRVRWAGVTAEGEYRVGVDQKGGGGLVWGPASAAEAVDPCLCRPARSHAACTACGSGGDGRLCGVCREAGKQGPALPGTSRSTCARHRQG